MPIIEVAGTKRNYYWPIRIEKSRGSLRLSQTHPEEGGTVDVVLLAKPQIDALRELLK